MPSGRCLPSAFGMYFRRDCSVRGGALEVTEILQRVVCRELSPHEIMNAALRETTRDRPLFEVNVDRIAPKGANILAGHNPHYVAFRKSKP